MANLFARNDVYKKVVNEGVWMEVKDPATGFTFGTRDDDGVPLKAEEQHPVRIKLLGYDSDVVQGVLKHFQQKVYILYKRDGEYEPTEDELTKQAVDVLVAATIEWENLEDNDGSPLSYSPLNARFLYENLLWVRQQVDKFINDKKNYGREGGKPTPSLLDRAGQLVELEKKSSNGQSSDAESSSD